jgi:three-Cys-motif partner protein
MSNDDHFQTYREHTQIKHAILKDYLSAWVPILGSWNNRIIYIDGFCGPGAYEHRGKTIDGSPIIALKIGEGFKDKVELVCIFVDKKKEYCENLECRIEELGLEDAKHYILSGTFEEELTELLDDVPNIAPTFCFIDPFGYSGLPLEVIRRFLSRDRTEAFINFMYEPISRWLTVDSQEKHMTELFGTDKWKYVIDNELGTSEKETYLRDLYQKQLETCANHVWPFQLQDPNRAKTIYYLFHCTNHPKGTRVMKEIMYRKGTVGTYSYRGKEHSQLSLFSSEPKIEELEEFLLDEFEGTRATFDDIVISTLQVPFIEKHYRAALTNLKKEGLIRKIPVTTKGDRGFNKKDIAIFP